MGLLKKTAPVPFCVSPSQSCDCVAGMLSGHCGLYVTGGSRVTSPTATPAGPSQNAKQTRQQVGLKKISLMKDNSVMLCTAGTLNYFLKGYIIFVLLFSICVKVVFLSRCCMSTFSFNVTLSSVTRQLTWSSSCPPLQRPNRTGRPSGTSSRTTC